MINIAEFDFATKQDRSVDVAALDGWRDKPLYWWIDVVPESSAETEALLKKLGVNPAVIEGVVGPDVDGRYEVFEDCIYFSITETSQRDGRLVTALADVVLGEKFLVTVHRQQVNFLDLLRRTYREDFRRFAKSPGFLLYEIGDHLVDTYRRSLKELTGSVEQVQANLFGDVDDAIFRKVSALTTDLLAFRSVVRTARELLHQLSTRKSPFIPETTQPFLATMAGTLERISDDLLTERDTLTESLNLYMGMVSHRTNAVVNRLTTISIIFLPLSFLCGVYGMNLPIPETEWKFAYPAFWILSLSIVIGLLVLMKKKKWI